MDIYTKLQGSEARVKMKCVGDGEDTIKRVKEAPATIRKTILMFYIASKVATNQQPQA